jgi:hypothetical protein
MIETVGGRKTIALLIILLTAIGTVLLKGDIPERFLSILEFLFTGYVAGNVGEHVANAIKTKTASKEESEEAPSSNQDDLTAIAQGLSDLSVTNESLVQATALIQQTLSVIINRTGIDKMPER